MNTSMSGNHRGSISILVAVFLIPLIMCLALVADSGRTWVAREALQNGVEQAAQTAAELWVTHSVPCADDALASASRDDGHPDDVSCRITGSSGDGTVTVSAMQQVSMMFADLIGRGSSHVSADTTVRLKAASKVSGLWPFGLCSHSSPVRSWISSGFASTENYEVSFDSNANDCGANVSGNWALLDFNGGSNSTSETERWINSGYAETVTVGDMVLGNTGVPSKSLNLKSKEGSTVLLAMFDMAEGSGSNALFRIVGFARAHLVSSSLNGSSSNRSMTIRFERGVMSGSSTALTALPFGLISRSVCALDSQGDCS